MKKTKHRNGRRILLVLFSAAIAVSVSASSLAGETLFSGSSFRESLREITMKLPLCSPAECAAKQNADPTAPALLSDDVSGSTSAEALSEAELSAVPHVWPLRLTGGRYISSSYGWRYDPITPDAYKFHAAIDIAAASGSKIAAAGSGTVEAVSESSGMGKYVILDHGNGYRTSYNHCSEILVHEGDEVLQGQPIALVGCTGYATGNHLDFRVFLNGETVNPLTVLDSLS